MKSYCEKCRKMVKYETKKKNVKEVHNGVEVRYVKEYDVCNECGDEFYSEDTYNHNIKTISSEIRKQEGMITIDQIIEITKKYNIGKKPLSLVLGWGEVTIIRYIDGQVPERVYSDVLLKILEDPSELLKYLERNKDLITELAYRKAVGRIAEIRLEEDKSKIYLIAKHIIAKMGDITPLALQKILYYVQGFSLGLLNKDMFNTSPEAWVHGPVYKDIYDRFSYYSYNSIDNAEFTEYKDIKIDKEELKLVDSVIDSFGCYSGKILEKMTHLSLPWAETREGLDEKEPSNKKISNEIIKTYFSEIIDKYNISSVKDIKKYSNSVFKQVSKM